MMMGASVEACSWRNESATSGVTGRYGPTGYSRLRPGITGWSRHFRTDRTGCDRLRPATGRQRLCSTCVVGALPTKTTDVAPARLGTESICGRLALVAPAGLHKCSILRARTSGL